MPDASASERKSLKICKLRKKKSLASLAAEWRRVWLRMAKIKRDKLNARRREFLRSGKHGGTHWEGKATRPSSKAKLLTCHMSSSSVLILNVCV